MAKPTPQHLVKLGALGSDYRRRERLPFSPSLTWCGGKTLRADIRDEQVVEVRLEEGQEPYLGMALLFSSTGVLGVKGHLVQFDDDEEAEERIAHLDRLADKKVTKVSDVNLAELKATPAK